MRGFARFVSRVVWYDYRGYGFSTGTAHFQELRADAVRIVDAVARSAGGVRNVVLLGYSMGTDVAEYVALRRPVRALILAAPWDDYAATYSYEDPKHVYDVRFTSAAKAALDEVAMVKEIAAPLLVFQGTKDDAIPPTQGPQLERIAASEDKMFVPIPGAKHDWLLENADSQAAVRRFIERLSSRPPA
jgi:pimeloyl-ACP methyl ester carboxylesterase